MTKRPFSAKGYRAKECLELVHSDVCGPMTIQARETAAYILNLVPSKSVPTTPTELWTRRKPSLAYIWILGSPAHVLVGNIGKLESRTEVCFFIGYPRGTKGGLFYSPKDQKVIVSTNVRFLEEDYMMNHKPKSKIVLEELRGEIQGNQTTQGTPVEENDPVPHKSGRIVESQTNSV
ncbi:uncharacterized protein LOC119986882 [Tripterygium wilfordii]|uniref:uncharacterized protein LOC119986882 n=1 Tax=Tripterygium wilfordii TaxID=458696 RepID=UPI0018F8566D|nr:uncharacterized protein LOC119986882 [Tripterygium wilfordii]